MKVGISAMRKVRRGHVTGSDWGFLSAGRLFHCGGHWPKGRLCLITVQTGLRKKIKQDNESSGHKVRSSEFFS